jgi:hypothetical protein
MMTAATVDWQYDLIWIAAGLICGARRMFVKAVS